MVCPRCILVVRERLSRLGLEVLHVDLGYVDIVGAETLDLPRISKELEAVGFEYIQEKDAVTVEKIKVAVLDYLHQLEAGSHETLSIFISRRLGTNYTSLSKLFSKSKHITIQQYLVLQKIERVKELLDYGDLSLSQIATKLGYSSVHYLSTQFKNVAGLSVSEFKELKIPKRNCLDQL
ncbi:AraC family transcriptional regulator [Cesiribacter sp. SM1]|uniref:helix-turn-helix domain-containing protein n=1 Tax=Cesiribacter sp. SM1 TaxID=2861196 RepID=UPI001CD38CB6|nr:helix-turn-helix domain-containing protein [Cesiribacter sp. SM1]